MKIVNVKKYYFILAQFLQIIFAVCRFSIQRFMALLVFGACPGKERLCSG